jgi:hypothetical protein
VYEKSPLQYMQRALFFFWSPECIGFTSEFDGCDRIDAA